ncbi:MAG: DnaB-like helicase C-terminal domain-containing protein [Candidatus Nanopelagicaceae bacterium]|nr:DnaB-like helicase C-terminal domain-containing protein [Candidatus Nanopelagicaceae bacterium]
MGIASFLEDLERTEERPAMDQDAFIKMAFNDPTTFKRMIPYIGDHHVKKPWQAVVLAVIKTFYEEHQEVPTRTVVTDIVKSKLTTTHSDEYAEIEKNVNHVLAPVEVKHYRSEMNNWLKQQKLTTMVSSDEAVTACEEGDDDFFREKLAEVMSIDRTDERPTFLSKDIDVLLDERSVQSLTCGFRDLDRYMNRTGPARGEAVCFMGRTGVGKSNMLCNAAIQALMMGIRVAYITLELHTPLVAQRMTSILIGRYLHDGSCRDMSGVTIGNILSNKDKCAALIKQTCRNCKSDIAIFDVPGKTLTADGVSGYIEELKRSGFQPDIVIIDYLDEMLTKSAPTKDGDYGRLKHISSDIRSLAARQNVLILTATQINRSKPDDEDDVIDLERTAESYGKNHPLDYIISLNQSPSERTESQMRLFIVKNRNGRPYVGIRGVIDPERLSFNFVCVLDNTEAGRAEHAEEEEKSEFA